MHYAVAHASVGTSVVLVWDPNNKKLKTPKCALLSTVEDKEEFIEGVKEGDVIFTELGGSSDRLSLACHIRNSKVSRVPLFKLVGGGTEVVNDEIEGEDFVNEDPDAVEDVVEESSADVERRKERAMNIYNASQNQPELFYPITENDVSTLELVVLWKGFHLMQKTRIATHLRLLSVYRDLYLVDAAQRKSGVSEQDYILNRLAKDKSFADLPPEARKDYLADLKSGDSVFQAVTEREKEILKLIEKKLAKMVIYEKVFKDVTGCGTLIAARMIGTIGDIRRFPELANLRAYCGMHHFSDGSRARRVKGKVSNWSMVAKQGCYQFGECVAKTPPGGSEWRDLLDKRRAYELVKLLKGFGHGYLPQEFGTMRIESINDVTLDDLDVLLAAIDGLRGDETKKLPGKKKGEVVEVPYTEYLRVKYYEGRVGEHFHARVLAAYEEGFAASDKETKKNLKGIKIKALSKAKRYVGQRFLKYIYTAWRQAIGLAPFPNS